MDSLSERKVAIVRTLVESAPDSVVGGLQRTLAEAGRDGLLAPVRRLVEDEARDRQLRNAALQPVAPLFAAQVPAIVGLAFPPKALAALWAGLKTHAPLVIVQTTILEEPPIDEPFDTLSQLAAEGLRFREDPDFRLAAELCDQADPDGAEQLAACLDLAPVMRRAIRRLPAWIAPLDEESAMAARLAYKDAAAVAPDAGPRFFAMLAAQLDAPWKILRVIAAVMDRPNERYLAQSELGAFPERVMDGIDETLTAISQLDRDAGPEAARAAAVQIELVTRQMLELESCATLSREQGWGLRLIGQRRRLADVVERKLREAERATDAALPTQVNGFGRARRVQPRLTTPPNDQDVKRAMTLLAFARGVRSTADQAGFSAALSKLQAKLDGMLDLYVEEVLEHVRTGEAAEAETAQAYLRVAADVAVLLRTSKAAELIRRRAAAARHEEAATSTDDQGR
jgi:hypothetical protein